MLRGRRSASQGAGRAHAAVTHTRRGRDPIAGRQQAAKPDMLAREFLAHILGHRCQLCLERLGTLQHVEHSCCVFLAIAHGGWRRRGGHKNRIMKRAWYRAHRWALRSTPETATRLRLRSAPRAAVRATSQSTFGASSWHRAAVKSTSSGSAPPGNCPTCIRTAVAVTSCTIGGALGL